MRHLVWHDGYSIGNEELDKHHKLLFSLYNNLCNTIAQGGEYKIIRFIVDDLAKYSYYHFEAEEKYMNDIGYSGIHGHIAEHKILRQKVKELEIRFFDIDIKQHQELIDLIGYWLSNHVIIEDKKIVGDNK